MSRTPRLAIRSLLAVAITALSLGSGAIGAQAATTYTIGIDQASPPGHLFMYTDFFPRGGTNVSMGDTVHFTWNTGSPDGFHTATLLKTGETPAAVYGATAPVVPDADDGAGTIQENPAIGAPGPDPTCGAIGTPCSYTGSAQLNSGAFPNAPGHDYYVTMNIAAPATVTFICLIHPGMVGSLSVVASGASTTGSVATAAAAQYAADSTEALAAEAAVTVPAATTNADGSKTWNAQAGTEAAHEQVLEFFPKALNVTAGDSVKWTSKAHDIHTVTFPDGAASAADDFHQFVCEAGPPDTPAAPAPAPPCVDPTKFESHFTGGPAGGTTLVNPTTVATSGVIAAAPLPFPDNYTFKVAGVGSYTYQCKVHDHMAATLAAVAALPKSGAGSAARQLVRGSELLALALLALLSLGAFVGVMAWRRRPAN